MARNSKELPWKTIAIVFIILFVLETAFFMFIISEGSELVEKENECSINICGPDEYTAFWYDDYEGICYCYTGDDITYEEYIG